MKAGIHPEYRKVVFQDVSSDFSFLTRSTMNSSETVEFFLNFLYSVLINCNIVGQILMVKK